MSLAASVIRRAAPAFNAVQCDVFTIANGPNAGEKFLGDAQTEAPILVDTDITSDGREKTVLYVDRPAPQLDIGYVIVGMGSSWSVVGAIDDNPANDRVKFEIVKVNSKDS